MPKISFEKILFALSFTFLIFVIGILFGIYNVPINSLITTTINFINHPKEAQEEFIKSTNIRNINYTIPINYVVSFLNYKPIDPKSNGLIDYDASKIEKGYTLINGMYKNNYALKLIDTDGNLVHRWEVPYCKFFSCKDLPDKQNINWVVEIGGFILYPNGDVVISHQYAGIVKLDKDSNVIWKKDYKAHHLMYKDKEGNIWTPGIKKEQITYKYRNNKIILEDPEYIFKISPEGELLEEYNIVDIIIKSDKKGLFNYHLYKYFNMSNPFKKKEPIVLTGYELTHLNDIEIVEDPEVYKLPMYEKGDILASMNLVNSLALIDPKEKKIKWILNNPFFRQHDPDILKDGNIMVFDNNGGGSKGLIESRSRILSLNPQTRKAKTIFERNYDNLFYSYNRGNQQVLPNGNILIVESNKGHIFEIDKKGKIVWEYFDIWDKDFISVITEAKRYPLDYVKFLKEKK